MKKLKKDITFIYMDSAEKSFMEILAEEASKRNYKVTLTDNKFARCEIGVYCQHINFPQYSKFSVIMLHDIIQQYGNWPDIWYREPWNKYDIGILPSDQWVINWNQCSQWNYTRPKKGMFKVGWPKADKVVNINREEYKATFYKEYHLDCNKRTILYAPSWENDHKQDDFVQAMLKLDVNILVKQYNATPTVQPAQYKNIREMYELHKDMDGVTLLDPRMNIFNAILASDVLVSEESSTMCEAIMMGIPSVSVSNWLIPDVIPSRYPECNYDFVVMTTKEKLTECIYEIINNYSEYQEKAYKFRDSTFSNIGNASSMIMDIIDDCVEEKEFRISPLVANNNQKVPFKKNINRIKEQIHRQMYANWKVQNPMFKGLWNCAKKVKDNILKNER